MKTLAFAILLVVQCASATITLDCTYTMHSWANTLGTVYTCNARVIQTGGTRNVVGVSQNHLAGRSNQAVVGIIFWDQRIELIPQDINLFFANLEGLYIHSSPIRSVTMADLRPFPRLRHFAVISGQLTTLNGDVFQHLPRLQHLQLGNNTITNVGPGIFQHSPQLNIVNLNENLCINSRATGAQSGQTIGRELSFACPPTVGMIEEIILNGERFREILNDHVLSITSTIVNRVKILEEENRAMMQNQKMIVIRLLHLEREKQDAWERIEEVEHFIFQLCERVDGLCKWV